RHDERPPVFERPLARTGQAALRFDAQVIPVEPNGELVLLHARQVGHDEDLVLVLVDIDRGHERPLRAARRLERRIPSFLDVQGVCGHGLLLESLSSQDWARTAIFRGCASGTFASVTVSTPFASTAVLRSGSTLLGSVYVRVNFTGKRSCRCAT